jgi:hypothetical protein
MSPVNAPLTRDRILAMAEDVIRRFGPAKATVVDVARAMLLATSRFHHPAHAAEWLDPAIATAYNDVWQLLMDGICAAKNPGKPRLR